MRLQPVRCTECGKHAPLYDCSDCPVAVQRCRKCAENPCPHCGGKRVKT